MFSGLPVTGKNVCLGRNATFQQRKVSSASMGFSSEESLGGERTFTLVKLCLSAFVSSELSKIKPQCNLRAPVVLTGPELQVCTGLTKSMVHVDSWKNKSQSFLVLDFAIFSLSPTFSSCLYTLLYYSHTKKQKQRGKKKANIQIEVELPVAELFPMGFGVRVPRNMRESGKGCLKAIPNMRNVKSKMLGNPLREMPLLHTAPHFQGWKK